MLHENPSIAFEAIVRAANTNENLTVRRCHAHLLRQTHHRVQVKRTCDIQPAVVVRANQPESAIVLNVPRATVVMRRREIGSCSMLTIRIDR